MMEQITAFIQRPEVYAAGGAITALMVAALGVVSARDSLRSYYYELKNWERLSSPKYISAPEYPVSPFKVIGVAIIAVSLSVFWPVVWMAAIGGGSLLALAQGVAWLISIGTKPQKDQTHESD